MYDFISFPAAGRSLLGWVTQEFDPAVTRQWLESSPAVQVFSLPVVDVHLQVNRGTTASFGL